jgi:hypothetical protein
MPGLCGSVTALVGVLEKDPYLPFKDKVARYVL